MITINRMAKKERHNSCFPFCSCNITMYWALDDIFAAAFAVAANIIAFNQRTRIHEQRTMLYFYMCDFFSRLFFSSLSLSLLLHGSVTLWNRLYDVRIRAKFLSLYFVSILFSYRVVKHIHAHIS